MKAAALALALTLAAPPLAALTGPQPVLAEGETIVSQIRADFNGDGIADLAYIADNADTRELRVSVSAGTPPENGAHPMQSLALDPEPNGITEISAEGDVLILREPTGGSTVFDATYRFRWDAGLAAMRLIGMDATLYSRSFAHDGQEASWNLLTGAHVTRRLKRNTGPGDHAYDVTGEKRSYRPSPPVRMEDAPAAEIVLDYPVGECAGNPA